MRTTKVLAVGLLAIFSFCGHFWIRPSTCINCSSVDESHLPRTPEELRDRLQRMLDQPTDEALLGEYLRFLRDHHVDAMMPIGDSVILGHAVELRLRPSVGSDWVLVDGKDKKFGIPKGYFVRWIYDGRAFEAAPTDFDATNLPGVFIGCGNTAFLIDLQHCAAVPIVPPPS